MTVWIPRRCYFSWARYFRNFAQSHNATYAPEGIHVCCFTVSTLVFGSDMVPGEDSDENKAIKKKIGDAYLAQAVAAKDAWVDEVVVNKD